MPGAGRSTSPLAALPRRFGLESSAWSGNESEPPDRRPLVLSGFGCDLSGDAGEHARRLKTAFGFGPQIAKSAADAPDGLLLHEQIFYSFFPMHAGMRQYWRDYNSLEKWTRSTPHREWWTSFLKNSGGTGFWHEAYFMRGGMEAIYDDMPKPFGMMAFAPVKAARGPMFSSASRAGRASSAAQPPLSEGDLY